MPNCQHKWYRDPSDGETRCSDCGLYFSDTYVSEPELINFEQVEIEYIVTDKNLFPDDYNDGISYGENVEPPVTMTEAYMALQEAHKAIDRIKILLHAKGLWTPPVHSDHNIPLDKGQLFSQIANVMQDINMIKQILLDVNFADNSELVPLTPRWRIDGGEHHKRQMAVFEFNVRRVLARIRDDKKPLTWKPKKNKIHPSR